MNLIEERELGRALPQIKRLLSSGRSPRNTPRARLSGRWPEFKEEKETGGKSLFLIHESGLWKKVGRLEKPYESEANRLRMEAIITSMC